MATTERAAAGVQHRLAELGARSTELIAPGEARRLVLATADDEWHATDTVRSLRAEGHMAVVRPNGGAQLDRWSFQTRPISFDNRLTVCFAWSEHDRDELPGLIELGHGGFGNGDHPTTSLIVEQLLKRITGGERVLDVGCGSGILALCALELGAARALGLDLDAHSIAATRRHAELNGVRERLSASTASLAEVDGTFDIVVANIARAGIVSLAGQLVARVAPGGSLIVSGISPSQCTQIAGFLSPLVEVERPQEDGWSALVLQ